MFRINWNQLYYLFKKPQTRRGKLIVQNDWKNEDQTRMKTTQTNRLMKKTQNKKRITKWYKMRSCWGMKKCIHILSLSNIKMMMFLNSNYRYLVYHFNVFIWTTIDIRFDWNMSARVCLPTSHASHDLTIKTPPTPTKSHSNCDEE